MNSKYKKTGAWVLTMVVISACLSGCTLANPEKQQVKGEDKLIGVFVTFENEIKDYIIQEGDTLYFAEKKLVRADGSVRHLEEEEINGFDVSWKIEGVKQKDETYKFDKIDGYYMGVSTSKEKTNPKNGDASAYMSYHYSGELYNMKFGSGTYARDSQPKAIIIPEGQEESDSGFDDMFKDADESITIGGTIDVNSKTGADIRMNKVYERADGSVYTVIPDESVLRVNKGAYGGSQSHKVSESYETEITGTGITNKSKKFTTEFEITVKSADWLESASIRQMDKENLQVEESAVDFSEKAQTLKLETNTAYVIIEENCTDENGEPYNKRTVYDGERLGKSYKDGHEIYMSHIFHKPRANGKFELIELSLVR